MPRTTVPFTFAHLRYAHPFFTPVPPPRRPVAPKLAAKRMSQWISQKLGPIPKPSRDPQMDLAEIIGTQGVQEIQNAGSIRFHATGDTGRPTPSTSQEDVSLAMTRDYSTAQGAKNPAFFLHLGDVIYGTHKDLLFRDEFYRPYKNYPGKIIALAGNHDGEVFANTDPTPLKAFLANFCAKSAVIPPIADQVRIMRATMTQPGVYWQLNAPFLQIIGLYSNIAEGPGYLVGAKNDQSQVTWLTSALSQIAKGRKAGKRLALIIAVHHPPYSNGGHSGSREMLAAINAACDTAGVVPDALLSGHAHNYQHHSRYVTVQGKDLRIPYIVAGCGGHNDSSVDPATGARQGDTSYDKSMKGYGYLDITVSANKLVIDMWAVPKAGNQPFESVTVPLS